MSDVTPIVNALNIALALKLGDPPTAGADNGATAGTNGTDFSASQRNQALNFAFNELANRMISIGQKDAGKLCEGLVATQSITFASGGTTINKDFIAPLALLKSDNNEFQYVSLKSLKQDLDPYLDAGYTIEANKLYAYQRSAGTLAQLTSGTGTFYYLKSERKDTTSGADIAVNTAPDTTVDATYWPFVIDWAAGWLCMNKAAGEWMEKAPIYFQQAESKFPKVANAQ